MMRKTIIATLALLSACQNDKAVQPKGPDDFAFSAAVEPQGSAALQRLDVPAAALVSLKRADFGDIRVFDASGKTLSLARFDPSQRQPAITHELAVYPIAGTAAVQTGPAVSIAIAQPGQTVSLEAKGAKAPDDTGAALIDARKLEDPAIAVTLDADLPAQVPITVTLEASGDLKNWELLGEKVLFSPAVGQPSLGGDRIPLDGIDLHERFLRVSWKAINGAVVRGASVLTAKDIPPPSGVLATAGARLADAHTLQFSLPEAAPVAAIRVSGVAADGVVPVKLLGRDAEEQTWLPLSAAIIRPGGKPARLDLEGAHHRQYRLEADRRSAGFSQVPTIGLEVEPLSLLVAFNGRPPYRLAIGNAQAEPNLFAPDELADAKALSATLPLARVTIAAAAPIVQLGGANEEGPFSPRKLALWAVLLAATAILAAAAWKLMKSSQPAG